jgi:phosphoribosyl-AMP cyclohydrolase
MMTANKQWLDAVKWSDDGLVAAIAQDIHTKQVLMMAWMNPEALQLTLTEKRAVYWSRSRHQLWRKGERSGHVQKLHDLWLDCDGDTLLLSVEQVGGIACHTGRAHCFFRKWAQENWQTIDPIIKNPTDIYPHE